MNKTDDINKRGRGRPKKIDTDVHNNSADGADKKDAGEIDKVKKREQVVADGNGGLAAEADEKEVSNSDGVTKRERGCPKNP